MEKYRVIKTVKVKDEESINEISSYIGVDAILLDTYDKELAGGTGKNFKWKLASKLENYKVPIILSGGLNPENVLDAIKKINPYAVDVSSGVESSPGIKNHNLVKEFIEKIRNG